MAEQENDDKRLSIVKIYVKDFSFESPQSPGVFRADEWKPQTNLNLRSTHTAIEGDFHEVVLTITVEAKDNDGDKTMFLCELQQARKIRYIGVSNFAAWQVMKAQAVAAQFGTCIDVVQPMYSLIKRQAEVELFPMALSEGLAVVPYSPLGSGLLTGKYQHGGNGRLATDKRYAKRYGQPWMAETAKALSTLAQELGVDPATMAVAWAAQHPAVTAPIISARSADQLAPSLKALDMSLSGAQYAAVETLSPRPAPATDRLEEVGS